MDRLIVSRLGKTVGGIPARHGYSSAEMRKDVFFGVGVGVQNNRDKAMMRTERGRERERERENERERATTQTVKHAKHQCALWE